MFQILTRDGEGTKKDPFTYKSFNDKKYKRLSEAQDDLIKSPLLNLEICNIYKCHHCYNDVMGRTDENGLPFCSDECKDKIREEAMYFNMDVSSDTTFKKWWNENMLIKDC